MAISHFVLIHTVCHGAWTWYKLTPVLEAAGHKVTALDLAASGIDPRQIEQIGSFDEYSEPLLTFMASLPEGEKVILVGESCGGINVAIAADKYPEKIAAVVFVNAVMPDTDHSPSYALDKHMMAIPKKDTVPFTYVNKAETITGWKMGFMFLSENVFTACTPEDCKLATMLLRKGSLFQSILAKREKFTKEGYGSIKRIYVYTDSDEIFKPYFHSWQIENYKPDKVYKIEGGDQKLMLSKTNELAQILNEVADT
ncbi:hypothetical protein P3X46_004601 [Hevea brasiliensis]|uniref:AB hydrolase-1 domain-containing protein n=1 Tax=Hevea brasiliensis TaxID=3981 RepID=A0ABQ9MXU9_HEVBR|nr:(S)-hydroxynitrile lyase-like [Hevea brasiliensis]KAJ9184916.1 hypothetical protein P3X46_004601 [Hevea brasiliensis]